MENLAPALSKEDPAQQTLRPEKGKLRARLGDTQIVELSDDEDDADLVGRDDDDTAGDASDPDFLKEYPDDTDVSVNDVRVVSASFITFIVMFGTTGSSPSASQDHQRNPPAATVPSVRQISQSIMPSTEQFDVALAFRGFRGSRGTQRAGLLR